MNPQDLKLIAAIYRSAKKDYPAAPQSFLIDATIGRAENVCELYIAPEHVLQALEAEPPSLWARFVAWFKFHVDPEQRFEN